MTDDSDLKREYAELAQAQRQALEDQIVNALRRVFAERDRHDAIRTMRDYGDERARTELEIARRQARLQAAHECLSDARQAGDEIEVRKAQSAVYAETDRLNAPSVAHERYTRNIVRAYQELFLRDAKAPLTPISPDLPEDVAELLQDCLGNLQRNSAANPPTREPDPAIG